MNPSERIRLAPHEVREDDLLPQAPTYASDYGQLAAPLRRAIARTRAWLLGQQCADGHWVAELEGDNILESEYILLLAYLGQHDSERAKKAAQHIIDCQLPDGGWAMYPGGSVDVSGSVKCYFALKLTGHDASADYMQKARAAILAHGGCDAVNSFTRFYLALLGQISYEHCPAVPPEVMLLPKWFPVNMYAVSAWSRTIIVPLSIMSACQPVRNVVPELGIRELFIKPPHEWPQLRCPGLTGGTGLLSWDRFFRVVDRGLKFLQRHRLTPLRRRALAVAEQWMIDRFEASDGLGAIFPPMIWSIVALKCLGYESDSRHMRYCQDRLSGLLIEEDDHIRVQPCKSPVWDTAITLRALSDSGAVDDPATWRAVRWLLAHEIRQHGDWSKRVAVEPAGWCFEYANRFYPDLDDTAMVAMALGDQFRTPHRKVDALPPSLHLVAPAEGDGEQTPSAALLSASAAAIERAEQWMLAMQNRDGGWGAFDRNNNREFLCHVPFADHNAMIDPSTPDLTGRVLECLGELGRRVGDPAVDTAVAYLRRVQEPDGSWFGRWGVNYLYGTWQVLVGLTSVEVPHDDDVVVSAANWLLSHQQSCGGWGESPDSYEDPSLRGQGAATASQTAWALMGLMAAGYCDHPAVSRGIAYLLGTQLPDGTWNETQFTGTGFPRVFYLRYHYYPIYFPLMALARWSVAMGSQLDETSHEESPVAVLNQAAV